MAESHRTWVAAPESLRRVGASSQAPVVRSRAAPRPGAAGPAPGPRRRHAPRADRTHSRPSPRTTSTGSPCAAVRRRVADPDRQVHRQVRRHGSRRPDALIGRTTEPPQWQHCRRDAPARGACLERRQIRRSSAETAHAPPPAHPSSPRPRWAVPATRATASRVRRAGAQLTHALSRQLQLARTVVATQALALDRGPVFVTLGRSPGRPQQRPAREAGRAAARVTDPTPDPNLVSSTCRIWRDPVRGRVDSTSATTERTPTMTATIAVHEFISLDGVFESPDLDLRVRLRPEDGRDPRRDHRRRQDHPARPARRTRCSRPAWRDRTVEDDPGAPFFNETEKLVVGAQRARRGVGQHHPPRRLRRRRDPPAQGRARRRHLHLRQRPAGPGAARATAWSTTCTCSSTRSRSARASGSGATASRPSSRSRRTTSTTTASCTWTTAPPEVASAGGTLSPWRSVTSTGRRAALRPGRRRRAVLPRRRLLLDRRTCVG